VIEEALLRHPDVLHAAAVGEPDEYAGEVPVAFVVLRPGSTANADTVRRDVLVHIPERPAVPKRVTVIEAMPMTAIGKVYKPALRLRAVDQALRERLVRVGLADRVSLVVDERPGGLLVRVVAMPDDVTAVEALMAPFALRCRIDTFAA
jgi:fatty-acyl-CoA synthase